MKRGNTAPAQRTDAVLPAGTRVNLGGTSLAVELAVVMWHRPFGDRPPYQAYSALPDGYEARGYGETPDGALASLAAAIGDRFQVVCKAYNESRDSYEQYAEIVGGRAYWATF